MALATNKSRSITRPDLALERQLEVAAANTIYEGAIVAIDGSGNAIVPTGSEICVGIAAGAAEATETVRIQFNHVEELTLTGADDSAVGILLYATDDNTLTATPNTCIVGVVVDVLTADRVLVLVTCGN